MPSTVRVRTYRASALRLAALLALALAVAGACATTTESSGPRREGVPPAGVAEQDGIRRYGRGELRFVGGVPFITLRGGRREMGEQYGALLAVELSAAYRDVRAILRDVEAYVPFIARPFVRPVLYGGTARDMERRLPEDFKEELKGVSSGSGIPYRDLLFAAGGMGTLEFACTSIAIRRGEVALLGRNLDWAPGWLGRMPVVVRYEPEGKQASLVASMLAFPTVALTGLNASGICLSIDIVSYDRKRSNRPVPVYIEARRALEDDRSMSDLESRLAPYRTDIGWLLTAVSARERETAVFELASDGVAKRSGRPDSYTYALNGFADPALASRHTPATIPANVALDDRAAYQEIYAAEGIVPGIDDMIRYLSDDELFGYTGYVGFESRSHSGTIQTVVMDGASGTMYLASEAGFAGWAAFNRFDLDGGAAPWKPARPIMADPTFRKILDVNSYYFQDMYGGRESSLYDRIDIEDGVEAIEAQFLFQLATRFPRELDPSKAMEAVTACRTRYPDYGSFALMQSELALQTGDKSAARKDALAALDARIIFTEQELAALEMLADLAGAPAERAERAVYASRVLAILDRLGKSAAFTGPERRLKARMERYARR